MHNATWDTKRYASCMICSKTINNAFDFCPFMLFVVTVLDRNTHGATAILHNTVCSQEYLVKHTYSCEGKKKMKCDNSSGRDPEWRYTRRILMVKGTVYANVFKRQQRWPGVQAVLRWRLVKDRAGPTPAASVPVGMSKKKVSGRWLTTRLAGVTEIILLSASLKSYLDCPPCPTCGKTQRLAGSQGVAIGTVRGSAVVLTTGEVAVVVMGMKEQMERVLSLYVAYTLWLYAISSFTPMIYRVVYFVLGYYRWKMFCFSS